MSKTDREMFYQFKANYYKNLVCVLVIVIYAAQLFYLGIDYFLANNYTLFIPLCRISTIIPLLLYLKTYKNIKNYKAIADINAYMILYIGLVTAVAIALIENKTYSSDYFLLTSVSFIVLCFLSSLKKCYIFYLVSMIAMAVVQLFVYDFSLWFIFLIDLPFILILFVFHVLFTLMTLDIYLAQVKIKQLVIKDPLTKLYNRNILTQLIDSNKLVNAIDTTISIVLVDIDYFKQINDNFGHKQGDEVLSFLGKFILKNIRGTDIALRYGGEEFLIILYGANATQAQVIMQKNLKKLTNAAKPKDFTISIGISDYIDDFAKSVDNADKALYAAKNKGRKQLVHFNNIKNDTLIFEKKD